MKKTLPLLLLLALFIQVGASSNAEASFWAGLGFNIGGNTGLNIGLGINFSDRDRYNNRFSYNDVYRNDLQVGVRLNWTGDNYRGYHYVDHQDRYTVRGGNDWWRDGRETQCRLVRSVVLDPRTGQPVQNYQANHRDRFVCLGRDGRWMDVDQNQCTLVRQQPVQLPQPQTYVIQQQQQPRPVFQQMPWYRPTYNGPTYGGIPRYVGGNTQPRFVGGPVGAPVGGYVPPVRRNIAF